MFNLELLLSEKPTFSHHVPYYQLTKAELFSQDWQAPLG